MVCKKCGKTIDDSSAFCNHCGVKLNELSTSDYTDAPSFGLAILGFFFPLIGFLIYLFKEKEKPKQAASAAKGAITRIITKKVLAVLLSLLCIIFSSTVLVALTSAITQTTNDTQNNVEVTIGEFKVTDKGYSKDTSLDVTLKNTSDQRRTYFIEIEAVDENGARIETDTVSITKLNPGQEVTLSAFEYVLSDKLEDLETATFNVLEVRDYVS